MVKSRKHIFRLLEENREVFVRLEVAKLGLFGSYVREEATEDSDLDFLVDFKRKTFDNYMDLKFFLEDLFHSQVDVVVVNSLKPRLKKTILDEVVYVEGL